MYGLARAANGFLPNRITISNNTNTMNAITANQMYTCCASATKENIFVLLFANTATTGCATKSMSTHNPETAQNLSKLILNALGNVLTTTCNHISENASIPNKGNNTCPEIIEKSHSKLSPQKYKGYSSTTTNNI